MPNSSLIQLRVDEQLKEEVTEIYEQLGLDLPTAIRMFLKKSVSSRGLPFDATLTKRRSEHQEALDVLKEQALVLSEMTAEEIAEEIKKARQKNLVR